MICQLGMSTICSRKILRSWLRLTIRSSRTIEYSQIDFSALIPA
ncbi:hypothetical protein GQ600_19910 [Phytophthora cactorum]|nr:hypothetical protein GQ600_19910 [Phytophthora cactorum]